MEKDGKGSRNYLELNSNPGPLVYGMDALAMCAIGAIPSVNTLLTMDKMFVLFDVVFLLCELCLYCKH